MTELKTLKEMECDCYDNQEFGKCKPSGEFHIPPLSVDVQDLRQEAIKWIKADIKVAQKQESGVDTKMLVACMKWATRFNITKEELSPKDKEGEIY